MMIVSHAQSEMKLGKRPKTSYFKKNFPNQYFEFHHILPKSIFPLWKRKKSNIVALTAREHYFCHQLLLKIYEYDKTKYSKMAYALLKFHNNPHSDYKFSSRDYERARMACAIATSYNKKGKAFSEEHKKNLRESILKSVEIRKEQGVDFGWKDSTRCKMMKWYRDNKEFLSQQQRIGWTKEVRQKFSNKKKEYFKNMTTEERENYKSRKKKELENPNTRRKMSDARNGKILYYNTITKERHYYYKGQQPKNYEIVNLEKIEKPSKEDIKELYTLYKNNGGKLTWNDFQRELKLHRYIVDFD
jgi:hypothetical protein